MQVCLVISLFIAVLVAAEDCRHNLAKQIVSCDTLNDLRHFLARACNLDVNALMLVS